MAKGKDPKNLKNGKAGQSSFSGGSLNDMLNNRGGGYGGNKSAPSSLGSSKPSGGTPSPFGNRPNPFANTGASKQSSAPTSTGGAGASSPFGNRPNPFGNTQQQNATPPTGQGQSQPQNPFGSNTFLNNLKTGAGTSTNPFGMPSSTQNAAQTPQTPSFKTPKQLKQELKQRKKSGKKGDSEEEARLRAELRQLQEGRDGKSGTNAFGTSVKGTIGSGVAGSNSPLFGSVQSAQAPQKPMAGNDFFSQLKAMSTQGTSANPAMSDEDYVDEKQQEILDQLERIQGVSEDEEEDEKRKKRGGWFWIILLTSILLVLSIAGFFVYRAFVPDDYEYVRVSVEMTDPDDVFYYTGVNGERIPISVEPGDTFDLEIVARNASSVLGDVDAPVWEPIYVRFRIWIVIDGEERQDFIEISPNSNLWMRYNQDVEDTYLNDQGLPLVSIDDGYYYFKGKLQPNQQTTLISELTFSLDAITEEVAGKQAQLFVQVEVLEDSFAIGTFWTNAPHEWILWLQNNGM